MFFVFNKEKIITYIASLLIVFMLFAMTNLFINNKHAIEVSTNAEKLLPIYSVDTDTKNIALTINCAWNADDIEQILKTLEENEVKITFFMVGEWIEKYPEYVKKINEAGHEIGSHSDTHPHVNNLNYDKNIEEIEKSNDKLEKLIGKRTNLYRAPYGEYNNTVLQAAKDKGYYTIQWSLDTLDYTGLKGEEMWNRLDSKITAGDIILMHNGTKHTADSLGMIIENIKQKGLNIVKISDIIYKDGYVIDATGKQKCR